MVSFALQPLDPPRKKLQCSWNTNFGGPERRSEILHVPAIEPQIFLPYRNHYTQHSILALQRLLDIPLKLSYERQAIGKIWSFVTNGSASLTAVS